MEQRRTYSVLLIKALDEERREFSGIATTPEVDSMGDVIESDGITFARNPAPLLLQHKHDMPIGEVTFQKPTKSGMAFTAKIPKVDEPGIIKDRTDEAWHSVKHGLIRAVSIGLTATADNVEKLRNGGRRVLKSVVHELSIVTLGANSSALITAVKNLDQPALPATSPARLPRPAISLLPSKDTMNPMHKGLAFTRSIIAMAATKEGKGDSLNHNKAAAFAAQRWGSNSQAASILNKAAVAGGGTGGAMWGHELSDGYAAALEFIELVRPMTILGKLQNARRIPRGVPVVMQPGGATAYWVGEGKARPLSRMQFTRESMDVRGVAALVVVSNDLLKDASTDAELLIRNDLAAAAAEVSDVSFIDPANAGSATEPASVTYGATTITSTDDLADDAESAIAAFQGSLTDAVWITHPRLAVQAGIRSGGKGLGCDMGARGGVLAGLPVITSEAVPYDTSGGMLALVDASSICLVDEGATHAVSTHATVEMRTNPTGDTITPTAQTDRISLWQEESAAIKVERRINWKVGREGAVVVVAGANYGAGA